MADNEQDSTTWYADTDTYSAEEQAKFVVPGNGGPLTDDSSMFVEPATSEQNSGKILAKSEQNSGEMVKSELSAPKKQGGVPYQWKKGQSGNPGGRRKKAFTAVEDVLSDQQAAKYFLEGLKQAILDKHSKTVIMFLKEFYDRRDGAPIPMLPDKVSGFTAVIMALRGNDTPEEDTE